MTLQPSLNTCKILFTKHLNYFSAATPKENRRKIQASPSRFYFLKFCLWWKQPIWWQMAATYLRNVVQPEIWKSKALPKSWGPNCPVRGFLRGPWQTPRCCRCCRSPRRSPFTLSLFLHISVWKVLLVRVHFQIHNLQKKFFFSIFLPNYGGFPQKGVVSPRPTPAARRPCLRRTVGPRRGPDSRALGTAPCSKTLL